MRFRLCIPALLVLSVSGSSLLFAQTNRNAFPDYKDIRPGHGEIVDHPAGRQSGYSIRFDPFSYPPDSVIYYLNGKRYRNARKAKRKLGQKGVVIEGFSNKKQSGSAKRVISIAYSVKSE
ncbi:hypothetical protein [Arsenicibacter rosenii]|uniref:Uncharacterized protein n=1 Tax=Arsenicibacter rosenii TaxID=1750698 RepID=A0A1S2VRC7_9BACT|nr:hypothetical protein [Arsenicibacter rosenii]OIN60726.1 hypothetical protein BLX24_01055 [Arsenicibacter rosenii]